MNSQVIYACLMTITSLILTTIGVWQGGELFEVYWVAVLSSLCSGMAFGLVYYLITF